MDRPESSIFLIFDYPQYWQVNRPPNLVGLYCKIVYGVFYVDTGHTLVDTTSLTNIEPIAVCCTQHAKRLSLTSFRDMEKALPLLPPIEHQVPPRTPAKVATFVQVNRDSRNPGVLDESGNRDEQPPYCHHVDDSLFGEIAWLLLVCTVCARDFGNIQYSCFPY